MHSILAQLVLRFRGRERGQFGGRGTLQSCLTCVLRGPFEEFDEIKEENEILPDDSIRHNEALAENGSEFRILYRSDNRSLLRVDDIRHELSTIFLRWRISRTVR